MAQALADRQAGFQYANLAIRGRRVHEIVEDQVPRALALHPDLVSFSGGINDALRRNWDLTALAQDLLTGVSALAGSGARVVIVTYGRPSRRSRLMGAVEQRLADYREVTHEVARRHEAIVVDFWDVRVFDDSRFWSEDRLHLNPVGHQRVAMAVLDALGLPLPDPWWELLPDISPTPAVVRAGHHLAWIRRHLVPWIGRRVAGRSSADGVVAKRPEYAPV